MPQLADPVYVERFPSVKFDETDALKNLSTNYVMDGVSITFIIIYQYLSSDSHSLIGDLDTFLALDEQSAHKDALERETDKEYLERKYEENIHRERDLRCIFTPSPTSADTPS